MIGVTSLLSAVAVALISFTPAGANSLADAKAQREALEAKRAGLASKINAAQASDAQLEKSYKALSKEYANQKAITEEARRKAEAAELRLKRANAKLAKVKIEMDKLHKAVVTRAVDSYVGGEDGEGVTELLNSKDINDFTRKSAVLDDVTSNFSNVTDRLREVKLIQTAAMQEQVKAAKEANAKKAEVEKAFAKLQKTYNAQSHLRAERKKRIADLKHEEAATAAAEARLNAIIDSPPAASGPVPPISGSGLMRPVGGPITSGFGYRWGALHAGVDFGVPIGTPIHAAQSGTVIFAGTMNGYGYVTLIKHTSSLTTLYAHQSRLGVHVGQGVARGQVIGYSGNTGHSTGPHVHFETRVNGTPVDPMRYL